MLDPNQRGLLGQQLQPPPGYVFDRAVALTYSLDLTTLLTVPLYLSRMSVGVDAVADPIAMLESIRRTMSRLVIVCQRGQIHVPGIPHLLYSQLESSIVEATPPGGGAFHPKLWVLRYTSPIEGNAPRLRVGVLTRNLTADRCWDLSLFIDGEVGGRTNTSMKPLGELLQSVESMATRPVSAVAGSILRELGDAVRCTTPIELPLGFEELRYDVLGLPGSKPWRPPECDRIAVISPFVTGPALEAIAERAHEGVAVVSREDELAKLPAAAARKFGSFYTLHDAAETEDGEDDDGDAASEPTYHPTTGLHAKAIICEHPKNWTTFCVGSANATTAALIVNKNVEVMATLVGKTQRVGSIDTLLNADNLGGMLCPFTPPEMPAAPTPQQLAEDELCQAAELLFGAGLSIACRTVEAGQHVLTLSAAKGVKLAGVAGIRAWPISLRSDHAADATSLASGHSIELGPVATASVTGLIAFEFASSRVAGMTRSFVLNVPMEGAPADRDAAVLASIISNRDGFLRYLILLLRDPAQAIAVAQVASTNAATPWTFSGSGGGLPMVEQLTRTYSRTPEQLTQIRRVIDELRTSDQFALLVPPEFAEVWSVFCNAMDLDGGLMTEGVKR